MPGTDCRSDAGESETNWAVVYAEEKDALHAIARRIVPDVVHGVDHQDIVAEVVGDLIATGPPSRFDSPGAYARRAVRNRAIDAYRRSRRRPEISLAAVGDTLEADDLETETDEDLLVAFAIAAIGEMPPRHAQAFEQVVLRARTRVDVGQEMGITPQRVGQLVAEAIIQLRSLVTSEETLRTQDTRIR